jgi:hypothetical protein
MLLGSGRQPPCRTAALHVLSRDDLTPREHGEHSVTCAYSHTTLPLLHLPAVDRLSLPYPLSIRAVANVLSAIARYVQEQLGTFFALHASRVIPMNH